MYVTRQVEKGHTRNKHYHECDVQIAYGQTSMYNSQELSWLLAGYCLSYLVVWLFSHC
ncbi:hypothetical protein DL95DRAFT_128162 [Leptodontidium sp. 2 PMI_412]|nr:hypothetical protein DL95DRAFT_128162 [Leptodontidium sp. 2 PMI_412]